MKNRSHHSILIVVVCLLFAGCSEGVREASAPTELSDADLTARLIELYDEPDRLERTEQMVATLRLVRDGQDAALEAALEGLDRVNRDFERVLIVTAWSRLDPTAATKWVLRNEPQEVVRVASLRESVYQWALRGPESIIRDMDMARYSAKGWDATTLRALVRGWYDSGEPHLEQFVYDLPKMGDDRQRAVSELIAAKLEHEGVEPAIEWATSSLRGDKPFNKYIYSRLAGDLARIDPQRAVAWCDEVCDTELGEDIPRWIASSWAIKDGASAMEWITVRDADKIPVRVGARAAYRRFFLYAPDEAFAWMESTTEQQRLERKALQGPIYMYANERSGMGQHDVAVEWARYLADEEVREELLVRVARRWLNQDADAAEAWLAQSSLSEEAKEKAHQRDLTAPKRRRGGGFGAKDTILR